MYPSPLRIYCDVDGAYGDPGRWHVCYTVRDSVGAPNASGRAAVLSSILDCPSQHSAQDALRDLAALAAREAAVLRVDLEHRDRKLRRRFSDRYDD